MGKATRYLTAGVLRFGWLAATSLAAGQAVAEEAAGAAEHKVGMPQLDPAGFASQIFWLAVFFGLLYALMKRVALPRVAEVLDQRAHRIQSDLDKAEQLKAEADEALATYQKTMAEARANAQAEVRAALAASAAESAKRESDLAAQLGQRTKAAEDGIAAAKNRALADVNRVAAEVAGSAVAKIAGLSAAPDQLQAAVGAALRERG
jgi:F-type H+-transporting ATPase subunit b